MRAKGEVAAAERRVAAVEVYRWEYVVLQLTGRLVKVYAATMELEGLWIVDPAPLSARQAAQVAALFAQGIPVIEVVLVLLGLKRIVNAAGHSPDAARFDCTPSRQEHPERGSANQ